MTEYFVKYTDVATTPIAVPSTEVNDTALDVTLFGRINPEYGEALNENLLNILENFACPEDITSTDFKTAVPDLAETSKTQLHNPTTGQFWYNSTREFVYYYDGTNWVPMPLRENYAANWVQIMDGQVLPRPYSPTIDYTFEYDECIWSVAPASIPVAPGSLSCATYDGATVRMQYRLAGTSIIQSGLANYLIIGIRGNTNNGTSIPPIDITPTPTPTMMASPTPAPSNTPAPSVTPTPGISSTPAPTPTQTRTGTPVVSVTPTPAPSNTPTPAPSNTPAVSNTPTPAPSNTPAPSVTPTPAPSVTPSTTRIPNPCGGGQGCDPSNANGNCGCPPGWNPVVGGCQRATMPFDFQDCP